MDRTTVNIRSVASYIPIGYTIYYYIDNKPGTKKEIFSWLDVPCCDLVCLTCLFPVKLDIHISTAELSSQFKNLKTRKSFKNSNWSSYQVKQLHLQWKTQAWLQRNIWNPRNSWLGGQDKIYFLLRQTNSPS